MASLKAIVAFTLYIFILAEVAGATPAVAPQRQGAIKIEDGIFIGFLWPVRGSTSSSYGFRKDPINSATIAHHTGIDIVSPPGSFAAASKSGIVIFTGPSGGYGNLVILRHANDMETRYGHLGKILIKKGTVVRPGQILGLIGNTGRTTGNHLHFEIRKKRRALDPLKWLIPYGLMMPPIYSPDLRK